MRKTNRTCDLEFLVSPGLESYYWIGYILADGHIDNKYLSIYTHEKDKDHLNILAEKLKTTLKINRSCVYLAAGHKEVLDKLRKKYKISLSKTYNPCDLSKLTNKQLKAVCIGFIDGDGYIECRGNNAGLKIRCHKSWLDNFKIMFPSGNPRIDTEDRSCVTICNSVILGEIKKFVMKNNLPVLNRKWENIDENYISKRAKNFKYIHPPRGW